MIVGVTGYFCSGKDTMASILMAKGFEHVSLSDMIRDEMKVRGRRIDIPGLTEVGNELRRLEGPGTLGRRALARMDFSRNWVVTSIRHPAEVEALRERPDFVMVFVDASQRKRFERSLTRARKGDPTTLETFAAEEKRQMRAEAGDGTAQQLEACRRMADLRITNNGSPDAFREKITQFLGRGLYDHFLPRPSWDEYFMMMAEVAATRGNCIKRRVGAVLVLNRQILSTGYNGTPKGITNCCDGGCPRGAGVADSGSGLTECIAVHAEENAIIQAAAHGVSIRGATLYCTLCPCQFCARAIINAGIVEVVYRYGYATDEMTTRLFKEVGVKLRKLENPAVTVAPIYAPRPGKRRSPGRKC